MALTLTENAQNESERVSLKPQIVLEIEGFSTYFAAIPVKKYLVYGDDVEYGDPGLTYGGFIPLAEQLDYISFEQGTTTEITDNVNVDKGTGSTIQSIKIALVDKDERITQLITPGNDVTELLGRRCKLWYGFDNTAFKQDFVVIFRGNIDEIEAGAGVIKLNIAQPEFKKRSNLFIKAETKLTANINNAVTTIPVDTTTEFFKPIVGPDEVTTSTAFKSYIKIDNEIIQYTGFNATNFTGCTRGALGTTAVGHNDNSTVSSFYRLTGKIITEIALPMMLSRNGPYLDDLSVTNFVTVPSVGSDTTAIWFNNQFLVREYNVRIGDHITTTGASNGANNVAGKQINDIDELTDGTVIYVTGVTFVNELASTALLDVRSKYDIFPNGMAMFNDEVDIDEHEKNFTRFYSSYEMDFYLKETIDSGKDFMDSEIYNPISAFSLVRKARVSMGVHFPPLPDTFVPIINTDNVKNASKLALKRSLNKNWFLGVVFKYEDSPLDTALTEIFINIEGSAEARFGSNVPNKYLTIESNGLRGVLNAEDIALNSSTRRLKKYRYGAEYIGGLEVLSKTGLAVEPGDIMLIDMSDLQISDIQSATRAGEPRLFQVEKKTLGLKDGSIKFDIVDTSFDKDIRYGLESPVSRVSSGASTSVFTIYSGEFSAPYGLNEWKKWRNYIGGAIRVRNNAGSTMGSTNISAIAGNQITVSPALSFTPGADYIMELDVYDNVTASADPSIGLQLQLLYVFMTDNPTFTDGKVFYTMV